MLTIARNGIITVNRGDDFSVPLFINQRTELHPSRYVLTETDKVYFSIALTGTDCIFDKSQMTWTILNDENDSEEEPIIKEPPISKTYTHSDLNENGDIVLKFTHEDSLKLRPGNYYYQIKAKITKNGEDYLNTIVKRTPFIILE